MGTSFSTLSYVAHTKKLPRRARKENETKNRTEAYKLMISQGMAFDTKTKMNLASGLFITRPFFRVNEPFALTMRRVSPQH